MFSKLYINKINVLMNLREEIINFCLANEDTLPEDLKIIIKNYKKLLKKD